MSRPSPKPPVLSRRQTDAEFRALQRLTLETIIRPLSAKMHIQKTWTDGRAMREVVREFIKPNDRLTSLERLEIYNRQYWFRVLDCLYDDYPGLRAILGDKHFRRLRIAYLARYPSASFTLRDLGSRLERFLIEEPAHAAPYTQMAIDMTRFEWAQVVAFDGEAKPALSVDGLLGEDPASLRLKIQPYVTILEMDYPLDDFVIALKKRDSALRSEASNAIGSLDADNRPEKVAAARRPKRQKTYLAVHRYDNALYYKRLDRPAYVLLKALTDGSTLADACQAALDSVAGDIESESAVTSQIGAWFQTWATLGWFYIDVKSLAKSERGKGLRRPRAVGRAK